MELLPKLPDAECAECSQGNRNLEHVRTHEKTVSTIGPDPDGISMAVFRCRVCGHTQHVGFDRDNPPT